MKETFMFIVVTSVVDLQEYVGTQIVLVFKEFGISLAATFDR